jgi:ribosomal protein S27E
VIGKLPTALEIINTPDPSTHVRCPDCREFVLKDARKCKHCGTALVPQ